MPPDDIRTSSSALITSSSKGKVMISTLPLGRSPPGSSQLTTSSMSPVTPMQHPVGVREAPGYSHSVLTKPVLYRSLPLQPSLNVASNVSEHGVRISPTKSQTRNLEGSRILSFRGDNFGSPMGPSPPSFPKSVLDLDSPRLLVDHPYSVGSPLPVGSGGQLDFSPAHVDAAFTVGYTEMVLLSSPCPRPTQLQSSSPNSPYRPSLHLVDVDDTPTSTHCHISRP